MPAIGLKPLEIGRSKHHDYYLDATIYERWEHECDGDTMLVAFVGVAAVGMIVVVLACRSLG